MTTVVGWDIGGAHLKAARAEAGRITAVVQLPSPLWMGLDRLDGAITEALGQLGRADRYAATMTGELADIFANRAEGVAIITARLAEAVAPAPLALYAGRAGFVAADAVAAHVADVASANWHATASLAARHVGDGLLIDMGSTTTDIIPFVSGKVAAVGYTDAERLTSRRACLHGSDAQLRHGARRARTVRRPLDAARQRIFRHGRRHLSNTRRT